MPSKKSYFNPALFRKNLTRFWPLWGGISLIGAIFPFVLLMELMSPYYHTPLSPVDAAYFIYAITAVPLPIFTLLYAILVAMAVWSYLYSPRSVGFMHTLPLHRRTIFCTNLLSGLAMLLIPYVVVGGLTCLILLCFGAFPLTAVVQTISAVIGYTIFYFGSATLVAMITSNAFALPIFYFILHFFAVIFELLLAWFSGNFIFGYAGYSEAHLTFLSPTVFFYQNLSISSEMLDDGTRLVSLEGLWIIWVYALAGIALLVCAYLLYRLRHSESAGEVVAYRPLKPVFRYGVALCTALTFGPLLYEACWGSAFQRTLYYEMLPMAVCMILLGMLGYYIASMLLAKSAKVFRGSGKGVLIVASLVAVLCAGVYFDVLGIGRRLPDPEEVESVQLYTYGSKLITAAGDPQLEEIIALQKMIMDSESEIRSCDRSESYNTGYEESNMVVNVTIDYYLKNGETLSRRYYIPMLYDRWDQEGSWENRLNTLLNAPETALQQVQPAKDAALTNIHVDYWVEPGRNIDLSGAAMEQVYNALCQDAQAGHLPGYDPFGTEDSTYLPCNLYLEYRRPYTDINGVQTASYSDNDIQVTSAMTFTLQALLDTGTITEEAYNEILGLSSGEMFTQPAIPDSFQEGTTAMSAVAIVTP